jgi:hypothetical protein
VYLAVSLEATLGGRIRVASTVTRAGQDGYKLETPHEVQELIRRFAPTANATTGPAAEDFNVLIATDAHGVGLDLQDATEAPVERGGVFAIVRSVWQSSPPELSNVADLREFAKAAESSQSPS